MYFQIFSPLFVENPHNTVKILELHLKQTAKKHEHSSPSEKQQARLQAYCDVLQVCTTVFANGVSLFLNLDITVQ